MEEFIKEIEERIKHLQEDVNVVSLAKISELTLVNKRLKQLLIQRVSDMFSVEQMEEAYTSGRDYESGFSNEPFRIENYR